MRILRVRIACFRKNLILRKFCDALLVCDCASKFDVLVGEGANCHAGDGIRVGHFRETHDNLGRRSFLRKQVIVNANDRSIPNDATVRQSCTRFEEIGTGEDFVCCWNARLCRGFGGCTTDVASCFGVVAGGFEGAATRHRQLKCFDEQFSLKFFCESCARIEYHVSRDGIPGVLFKFFHTRGDSRQFLGGNARQFPCNLWGVDLEERKAQFLARTGKHLPGREDQARFFRSKRCAPARFRLDSVAAVAL